MGTALTGSTQASTYDALLKVTDNGPLGGTAKVVTDGMGNDSVFKLGTADAEFTGPLKFKGTTTNNDVAAGYVGEYVSGSLASGSAVSLSSSTATDLVSISLTAGDWDVCGVVRFNPAATTTIGYLAGSISTTTGVHGAFLTDGFFLPYPSPNAAVDVVGNAALPTPMVRISIAGTTTVYLVAEARFGVSTCGAYGSIRARRVR